MAQANNFVILLLVFAGIFLFFIGNRKVYVEAIVPESCDGTPSMSYCLDCLTFAVCDAGGSYIPIGCPTGTACEEDSETATCQPDLTVDHQCSCSGYSYPESKDDKYDPNDKLLVCLSANIGPDIECKHGGIYNDATGECDNPYLTTPYPAIECNNKLEFICLSCDYYQICLADNSAQTYKCPAYTLCNEPANNCIPTMFTCDPEITSPGFQGDPYNCTVFYYCNGESPTPYTNEICPDGEVFVYDYQGCKVDPDTAANCPEPYDCSSDVTFQPQFTSTIKTTLPQITSNMMTNSPQFMSTIKTNSPQITTIMTTLPEITSTEATLPYISTDIPILPVGLH